MQIKDIIIYLILIIIAYAIYKGETVEHMTDVYNEAIGNLANLYNEDDQTLGSLRVTTDIDVENDVNVSNDINVANDINVDGSSNISGLLTVDNNKQPTVCEVGDDCSCNGTVYFGKKFVNSLTGTKPGSDDIVTLQQMKDDGAVSKAVSGSIQCSSDGFDISDPEVGFNKHCMCEENNSNTYFAGGLKVGTDTYSCKGDNSADSVDMCELSNGIITTPAMWVGVQTHNGDTALELGRNEDKSTIIDFHTSADGPDYDARILAGTGKNLNYVANGGIHNFNGKICIGTDKCITADKIKSVFG